MTPRTAAFAAAIAILLAYDVAIGGRIAQRSPASRPLRMLSGLCGFLVSPALLVFYGAQSVVSGRVLAGLAWIGPLTLLLFAAQVAWAWARGLVSPALALPLLAFDLTQLYVATAGYVGSIGYDLPPVALVPVAAQAAVFAAALGPAAFASPFAVAVPLLAPAFTATGRVAAAFRAVVAAGALCAVAAVAATAPAALKGLNAYDRMGHDRIAERARESFTIGLSILPPVNGMPSAANLRDDLALADSLDVGALHVSVGPEGSTAAGLDSLARALDPFRRDSTLVLASVDIGRGGQLAAVNRVVRRLHPDYLVLRGTRRTAVIAEAATLAHRLGPATRVAVEISPAGAADSALYEWASSAGSPIEAVALVIRPASGGALRVLAALARADRWMQREGRPREQWIFAAAAPSVDGEDAQRRLVRHVLAFGSAHPGVQGVVLGDAADYAQGTGLRTVRGRLRRAVDDAALATRSLIETSTAPPP